MYSKECAKESDRGEKRTGAGEKKTIASLYLHNQPKCSVVSHVIVVVVGFDFDYFGLPIILGRTRYHRLLHQHVDVEFRAHVGQANAHKLILPMLQAN